MAVMSVPFLRDVMDENGTEPAALTAVYERLPPDPTPRQDFLHEGPATSAGPVKQHTLMPPRVWRLVRGTVEAPAVYAARRSPDESPTLALSHRSSSWRLGSVRSARSCHP